MRLIAFLTEPASIRTLLAHLGEPATPPMLAPRARDPPIGKMMATLLKNGGRILACPPCARVRGYAPENLVEGVTLAGAPAMLQEIAQGAAAVQSAVNSQVMGDGVGR